MEFVCWDHDDDDLDLAWLKPGRIEAFDGVSHLFNEPASCAAWFPENLVVPTWDPDPVASAKRKSGPFDPDMGRGERMTDSLPNTHGLRIVSPRMKAMLAAMIAPDQIEFLPMGVQRGERVLPYFIAHPLRAFECIDREQSELKLLNSGRIHRVKTLVLDTSGLPGDIRFFRAAEFPQLVLIEREIAQALVDDDCEGAYFLPAEEYGFPWG